MQPALTQDDCDRSINFWERGPVRQILDLEFEKAFVLAAGEAGVQGIDAAGEQRLHDAVVPEVLAFVIQGGTWKNEAASGCFSLERQQAIQREMGRRIGERLRCPDAIR